MGRGGKKKNLLQKRRAILAADGIVIYQSKISMGEIRLIRATPGERDKKRMQEFLEKLAEEGLEISIPSKSHEESLYDYLDDDSEEEIEPIWQASLNIETSDGYSIEISTSREGREKSKEVGFLLEEIASQGPLYTEEIQAKVISAPSTPEEDKKAALDMVAGGEDSQIAKLMRAMGHDYQKQAEMAREVILGERSISPVAVISTDIFTKELGQLQIVASGASIQNALECLQQILPGATLDD